MFFKTNWTQPEKYIKPKQYIKPKHYPNQATVESVNEGLPYYVAGPKFGYEGIHIPVAGTVSNHPRLDEKTGLVEPKSSDSLWVTTTESRHQFSSKFRRCSLSDDGVIHQTYSDRLAFLTEEAAKHYAETGNTNYKETKMINNNYQYEDRKPVAGDLVLWTDISYPEVTNRTVGKPYLVIEAPSSIVVTIVNNIGKTDSFGCANLRVIKTKPIEQAKVGDIMYRVRGGEFTPFSPGTTVPITRVDYTRKGFYYTVEKSAYWTEVIVLDNEPKYVLGKTPIKLRVNQEQSRLVQEICFDNNIYWGSGCKAVQNTGRQYLYIGEHLKHGDSIEVFKTDPNLEVKAEEFIEKHKGKTMKFKKENYAIVLKGTKLADRQKLHQFLLDSGERLFSNTLLQKRIEYNYYAFPTRDWSGIMISEDRIEISIDDFMTKYRGIVMKKFTKEDLKTGMMVETESKDYGLVLGNAILWCLNSKGGTPLDHISDNLHSNTYPIVKVYAERKDASGADLMWQASNPAYLLGDLIYEVSVQINKVEIHKAGYKLRTIYINRETPELIHIGCFTGTFQEAVNKILESYKDKEAAQYIAKVAECFKLADKEFKNK